MWFLYLSVLRAEHESSCSAHRMLLQLCTKYLFPDVQPGRVPWHQHEHLGGTLRLCVMAHVDCPKIFLTWCSGIMEVRHWATRIQDRSHQSNTRLPLNNVQSQAAYTGTTHYYLSSLLDWLLHQIINIYLSDCWFADWRYDECPCICRLSNTTRPPPHWSLRLWNIRNLKRCQSIPRKEQRRHIPPFNCECQPRVPQHLTLWLVTQTSAVWQLSDTPLYSH